MSIFNENSRTKNVLRASSVGVVCNGINILMGFLYRTVFLWILSEEYLGINGLFTNILYVLSLSELGITTAITYRFYEPISRGDVRKVGQLMQFMKRVYAVIALTILVLGLSLLPFLNFFIRDTGEVPSDVNLKLVYLLFLFQTVSSYLYAYKQTILGADQRQYLVSLLQTVGFFVGYVVQLVSLLIWKNFTLTLAGNIMMIVFYNFCISLWVTKKYRPIFQVKENLPVEERKQIYADTKATLMHKVGSTVVFGTDNVVVSKFIGLAAVGLYSNYGMIINALENIIRQLFSSFTSSLGNASVTLSKEDGYAAYKKLIFANFWIVGMVTVCLYLLVDDFIMIWLGPKMLLTGHTVFVLCLQFYISGNRKVTCSYIEGCGLFVRDRYRPLIEAGLNLVISVILAMKIGIAGVFWGTAISYLLTIFWREPYILYKHEFHRSTWDYWKLYLKFAMLTAMACGGLLYLKSNWIHFELTLIGWILQGIFCVVVYNITAIVLFFREREFAFYLELVKRILRKVTEKR